MADREIHTDSSNNGSNTAIIAVVLLLGFGLIAWIIFAKKDADTQQPQTTPPAQETNQINITPAPNESSDQDTPEPAPTTENQ